jgi:hypothetical protein
MLPANVQNGDSWDIIIEPFVTSQFVGSTFLGDSVLLSNELELLSEIKGNLVQTPNNSAGVFQHFCKPDVVIPNYRTPILAQHYNHVFLVIGRTLYWTDLDSLWNWYPDTNSEADFRELEMESEEATGLVRVNELLYLHFPRAIYVVEYVGKPTIVRITSRCHGCGSINHRSLLANQNVQYFLGLDNFYLYGIEFGSKPIGTEIWKQFILECTDITAVWCYLDSINNEVCWVSGDIVWAFNYREGHWARYSSNGMQSHCTSAWRYNFTPISEFGDLIIGETDSIIEKVKPRGIENLWVKGDRVGQCLLMESPFLESDDINYGDMNFNKGVDVVHFDANYGDPWMGIQVYISGRQYTADEPAWVDCGIWQRGRNNDQRDFPMVSAKCFRFKFVFVERQNTYDGTMTFGGGHNFDGAAKEVYDGSCQVEGANHSPIQVPKFEGLVVPSAEKDLNFFVLHGWGERVDLPSKLLIGPDK